MEVFRNHLLIHSWHEIILTDSIDEAVELWESFLMKTVDELAPMKKKRVRKQPAPWMNSDIIQLMKRRDNLKRQALKNKDDSIMNLYRKARNLVTKTIRIVKKEHFANKLNKASNNNSSVNIWSVLKPLLPSKKTCK